MPDTPTPGQVNYKAFMRAMFPETPQHTALAWRWVEAKDRTAWEAAAQAVLTAWQQEQARLGATGWLVEGPQTEEPHA